MGKIFDKNHAVSVNNVIAFSGATTSAVGLLGLAAWITGLRSLASIRSDYIPMSPDSAMAFMLLGLILFLHYRIEEHSRAKLYILAIISFVAIYGLLKAIEYFVDANLTFENILFPTTEKAGTFFIKRMSPITGVLFFSSGIALQLKLLSGTHLKFANIIGSLGVITLIAGFVSTIGYVFGTPLLYGSGIIPLAATTAVGFLVLGFGLVAMAGPENIFVRPFVSNSARAKVLRYFLPITIMGALVQGFLSDVITNTYSINHTLADALFSLAFATLMSVVIVQLSQVMFRRADRAEAEAKRAKAEFRRFSKFPLENPNPILRVARNGTIFFANQASTPVLTAWDREVGQEVPENWLRQIEMTFESGEHKEVEIDCNGQIILCTLVPDLDEGNVDIYGSDHTENKKAENAIRESEKRYSSLFMNMLEGYAYCRMLFDGEEPLDFIYLDVNKSFEKLTGLKNVIGKKVSMVIPEIRESDPELFAVYGRVALTGNPEVIEIYVEALKMWFSISVYSPQREYFVAVFDVITGRKRAEEEIQKLNAELETRVVERTAQLEAANKELTAFAYSVSHDLRAPLRSIDGFSLVLLEDYAKKLDEKGKDSLQRIRAATQRMAQLMDDILGLSRVSRSELCREDVNLSAIADEIATELRRTDPRRDIEFAISSKITASGDAHLLHILLDNLMRNAFKFTSKHAKARIEFGMANRNGTRAYYVRDDGAGFDMKYADKMFGAFQRMHSSVEFPGTGIGLATVQRIINRHGGRVWSESEVERGATFYFTLQK